MSDYDGEGISLGMRQKRITSTNICVYSSLCSNALCVL